MSFYGVELSSVRLDEQEAKIEVYMVWRKGEETRAVLDFLGAVRKIFKLPTHRAKANDLRRGPTS